MRATASSSMGMPPLPRWIRDLLVALLVLYVVELIAWNVGVPLGSAMWWNLGTGFAPWQLVTHFAVNGRGAVTGVLLSLLVLYFFLPVLTRDYSRSTLLEVMGATAVGAIGVGLLLDAVGLLAPAPSGGWHLAVTALVVLFGLTHPGADIRLYFVLPVQGIWFVYGTILLTLLGLLAQPVLASAEAIGAWVGVVAWWYLRGPGRRRAELKSKARAIERELSHLTVLPGGRDGNRPGGRYDVH